MCLTPMRCPMVTEKPMERAADPMRPFLLSSVTAKMHTTSCMVRKTSTVVAIPMLMPGCSCRYTWTKTDLHKPKKLIKIRIVLKMSYSDSELLEI